MDDWLYEEVLTLLRESSRPMTVQFVDGVEEDISIEYREGEHLGLRLVNKELVAKQTRTSQLLRRSEANQKNEVAVAARLKQIAALNSTMMDEFNRGATAALAAAPHAPVLHLFCVRVLIECFSASSVAASSSKAARVRPGPTV